MTEKPRVTVGAMIFDKNDKILLLKSQKFGGKYIFPCGHVEFGETLENAVKREVFEETGLKVKEINFLKILEFIKSKEYHNDSLHFVGIQFTCKTDKAGVKLNEEAESYLWVLPSQAIDLDVESGTLDSIKFFLKTYKSN